MLKLWLDDNRDPKDSTIQSLFGANGDEVWVKTVSEAIDLIGSGYVSSISIDHDLGDGNGDGYEVAKFIEEGAFDGSLEPFKCTVHSKNPVGARRVVQALENANKFWKL